jgi:hypothetical protein
LANDDAINDFAPEESGEPRSAPQAAEHDSSADVHATSSRDPDVRERAPEVDFEELFSQIDSGELAPLPVDFEPASQIDFDELADIYASPSSPEVVAPAPDVDVDGAASAVDGGASADVYASRAPEVDDKAVAETYRADSAAALNGWPDDNVPVHHRPAPYESSGGVQVLAALATVGMLTIMYAVFVNERSSPLSIPPRVTAPAPAPTSAPELEQLASLEPPVVSDAVIPPPPSVRPRPYFDDPFGLTRGLGPPIPLQGFDVPPRSAAADNATPPATEPVPPVAPVAAPAAAAPEPSPSATPAPAPSVVTSPPPAAPPTVTASPPATASVPRNPAPPTTSAPSSSGASAPPTAALATPTPAPAPARSAPAPVAAPAPAAASPAAASAVVENNQSGIQNTLARYRKAFSALNASAAREVWPTVNERSLSRAFDRLEQQDVSFDRCQIEVTNNDRAEATCNGTARYVPRVGSRTPRVDQREWRFNLVKVKDQWLIGAVDAR